MHTDITATGGDFDNNGLGDLALGVSFTQLSVSMRRNDLPSVVDENERGSVYLFFDVALSDSEILVSEADLVLEGEGPTDRFGTLIEGADFDLNGDRIADLIILDANPNEDVRAFRSLTHVMRAGVLREQRELRHE